MFDCNTYFNQKTEPRSDEPCDDQHIRLLYTSMQLPYFIMGCNRSIIIVYCTPVYCTLVYCMHGCDLAHIASIGRFATSISLREHANERYAKCLVMNWCSKHLIIINNPTQNDLFTEIDNFIEVYNNSVIELVQCFGTSFFGRIDHLASSVIKFRPKNSVPKHCICSIIYIIARLFIARSFIAWL